METPQSSKTSNQQCHSRTNLWGAIRDIVISAYEQGQFLATIVGTVVIIIFLKMSPENLFKLVGRVFYWIENVFYIGWLLFLICAIGWYTAIRKLAKKPDKRILENEI